MRLSRSIAFTGCVLLGGVVIGVSMYAQGQGTGTGQGQTQGQTQGQAQGAPPQGRGRGGPAQNLQVLPKDWTTQQVQQFMRTYFTAGLGVECSYCHVGTPAERAKDDKPEKNTARKMLKMVMAINDDFLKDVGDPPAAGTMKVTCYTCHRGMEHPVSTPPGRGGN